MAKRISGSLATVAKGILLLEHTQEYISDLELDFARLHKLPVGDFILVLRILRCN